VPVAGIYFYYETSPHIRISTNKSTNKNVGYPLDAIHARTSSTFHAVTRADSFTG
jgi:hypothetical protein